MRDEKRPQQETRKETMRETVLEEMASFRSSHPEFSDNWRRYFFNNFVLNIFGRRERLEKFERELGRGRSDLDKKVFIKGHVLYSEKKQDQTPREFFDEIDNTIKELGIDGLEEIYNKYQEKGDINEFYENEKLLNLYVKLREKGYNHYPDLTS